MTTKTAKPHKRFKSYPNYKPSDIEWLGEIPKHWQIHRSKVLFQEVNKRSETGEEELLTVSHKTGITRRSEKNVSMFMAETLEGYKKCEPRDLVINTMWAWMGALGIAQEAGIVSPSYNVYQLRDNQYEPWFYDYMFRTRNFIAEMICYSKGIWTSRLRLYPEEFFEIRLPCPPLSEQQAISSNLDRETARIDVLIKKKEWQIELLQEKRAALIHEAIQDAATQNFRVGYIADQIQWPVRRMDNEIYVPIGMYNRGRGIFHKEPTVGAELGDSDFFWVEANDLVLSGQFAWEGAVALTGEEDAGCVATHRYPILRGKPGLMDTAYLFAFFTTKTGNFLLNEHSRGAAGRNRPLNVGTLLKEVIPVPPLAAQLRVSKQIHFERQFRRIIATSIKLLAEYRTALISAAVTGKIDVREAV